MSRRLKKVFVFFMIMTMATLASCGSKKSDTGTGSLGVTDSSGEEQASGGSKVDTSESFAKAHDAFTTTLAREENDDYPIPDPPKGLFDLVSYPSETGNLAAYVSSDPGDGRKYPMIIWVVGGWGNGIDDFPWVYPDWDNDQTGSAFWQEGILTMYPSFRGGSGNPGYYEALFGEVDDIVSAYEYAASLPYVDPQRIYLGGHSTGGTRALLASEYTDRFRAVFCFGAVDEIKYHNNTQFTFDLENEDEYTMRSPIHWLDDIKSPTFLIEGRDGNSANLERMLQSTQNESLHGYVVEGADHFSVLGPATRLVAQKILEDTGEEASISITQEELNGAMEQEAPVPSPVLTSRRLEELGMTISCPYVWEVMESANGDGWDIYSRYENENPWDMSMLCITAYGPDVSEGLKDFGENMKEQGYVVEETLIDGHSAVNVADLLQSEGGGVYYQRYVLIQNGDGYVDFNFIVPEDYMEEADILFQDVIGSVAFDQ